jgi:hypothetical protein
VQKRGVTLCWYLPQACIHTPAMWWCTSVLLSLQLAAQGLVVAALQVKVIQSILDRPLSVVGYMAVKCPGLIYTTCQDDVRRVVEGLQRVTQCNAVFAVKVAEAAPE